MCTCFIPNDAETLNLPSSIENRIWKFQTILTYEEVATGNKTLKTKKRRKCKTTLGKNAANSAFHLLNNIVL